jgi:pyridine nucleotide-disulfide oxidoreductase
MGPIQASDAARAALAAHQIRVREDPVSKAEGEPGRDIRLHLAPGWTLERRALFTHPVTRQRSGLAQQLGCTLLDDGSVLVNELGQTTVPGVYAAGTFAASELCPTQRRRSSWPPPRAPAPSSSSTRNCCSPTPTAPAKKPTGKQPLRRAPHCPKQADGDRGRCPGRCVERYLAGAGRWLRRVFGLRPDGPSASGGRGENRGAELAGAGVFGKVEDVPGDVGA